MTQFYKMNKPNTMLWKKKKVGLLIHYKTDFLHNETLHLRLPKKLKIFTNVHLIFFESFRTFIKVSPSWMTPSNSPTSNIRILRTLCPAEKKIVLPNIEGDFEEGYVISINCILIVNIQIQANIKSKISLFRLYYQLQVCEVCIVR